MITTRSKRERAQNNPTSDTRPARCGNNKIIQRAARVRGTVNASLPRRSQLHDAPTSRGVVRDKFTGGEYHRGDLAARLSLLSRHDASRPSGVLLFIVSALPRLRCASGAHLLRPEMRNSASPVRALRFFRLAQGAKEARANGFRRTRATTATATPVCVYPALSAPFSRAARRHLSAHATTTRDPRSSFLSNRFPASVQPSVADAAPIRFTVYSVYSVRVERTRRVPAFVAQVSRTCCSDRAAGYAAVRRENSKNSRTDDRLSIRAGDHFTRVVHDRARPPAISRSTREIRGKGRARETCVVLERLATD